MADIEIGYKGSTITSINSGGVTTLNTIGTFCEDNITVTFNKTQGEAFTPATTITTNPSITLSATTGTITAFYSGASNITPTVTSGYVSAGTAGTVRTSGTSTYQLSTVAAQTITPTTASQLAVASGRFTTGNVYVGAIPIPAFDVTWDDDWMNIVAVTCNMTFAECAALTNEEDQRAIAYEHDQSQTHGCYTAGNIDAYHASYIKYTFGQALYDLRVNSNGTITWNCPSTKLVTPGTPTASKGSVSNHSVSITPSVTNPYGYIYGGTITGSPVTVSASELVSGTLPITSNGTYDVTEYASASISVAGGEYYEVYKAIALNSVLSSGVEGLEAFCNTVSSIPQVAFAGRTWSGEYTFNNLNTISTGGFMFPNGVGYVMNAEFSFNLPQCSRIGDSAFYHNPNIRYINASMCSRIDHEAFASCSKLAGIDVPLCSSIASSAFIYCSQLTSINFPSLRSLGGYAFSSCSNLSYAYMPNLSIINNYTFNLCTKLEYIQTSNITSIGSYAFAACISLSSINLLSCTSMGMGALANCGLSIINAPLLMWINSSVFAQCKQLNTVILSNAQIIYTSAFASCYNFISLYLLGSSIVSLTTWNAFNSTPISTYTTSTGGVYGSIFVKASLYDSYLTAKIWSLYSSRFVSLTDAQIQALGF